MSESGDTQVFLNGRFLTQGTTGVQRHAREVVCALDRLLCTTPTLAGPREWTLLAPRGATLDLPLTRIAVRIVGRLGGHLWEQLELPRYAAGGVLLGFANSGPLRHRRQAVTIHDAAVFAVPEAFSPQFRRWYRLLLPRLAHVAQVIMTDSRFSAGELVRHARAEPAKLRVVPLGADHLQSTEPDYAILDRFSLGGQPFVLAVGSQSRHKNFAAFLDAVGPLAEQGCRIVVAGGANPRIFGDAAVVRHPDRLTAVGYVTDGQLRALYEAATCFVFPSLYEGFGLPPLEAMSCGCPVVASSAASIGEVCGDAAVYCDPRRPDDIRRAIVEVLDAPSRREDLRRRGLARAATFTWLRTARQILEVADDLCDSAPTRPAPAHRESAARVTQNGAHR